MKISRHIHSCLLVEEQDTTIIIDPGVFTAMENGLDLAALNKLDYILITHEHADHMHLPLIKDLVAKFPDVKIISNASVVTLLAKENITASSQADAVVTLESVPHEKLWDSETPDN